MDLPGNERHFETVAFLRINILLDSALRYRVSVEERIVRS
jgi:hypothetical protein